MAVSERRELEIRRVLQAGVSPREELTLRRELIAEPAETQPTARSLTTQENIVGGARSFLEGLTFNVARPIGLGIAALAQKATGADAPLSEIFRDMQQSFEIEKQQFEQARPKTAAGLQLAGALSTGIAAAPTRIGQAVARAPIRSGAGIGALAGLGETVGEATSLGEIAERAPGEVATGAVLGTVGGAAVRGLLGRAATTTKPATGGLVGAGIRGFRRLRLAEQRRPLRLIEKGLRTGELTPEQASTALRELGPKATLADVGGDAILRTARGLATAGGRASQIATDFLRRRTAGISKRLFGDARALTGKSGKVLSTINKVRIHRQNQAGPLYQRSATDSAPVNDIQALRLSILQKANDAAGTPIGGALKRVANMLGVRTGLVKELTVGKEPAKDIISAKTNIKQLHFVKVALDDMADSAFRNGKGNLGSEVKEARNLLVDIMDKASPAYREARKIYSDDSAFLGAVKDGMRVLREDAEIAADKLSRMSLAEKDAYIVGAVKAIRDRVLSGDKFTKELVRERLRNAFPDEATFSQFERALNREKVFGETARFVLGGSPTANKAADVLDTAIETGSFLARLATRPGSTIVQGMATILGRNRAIPDKIKGPLAEMLLTPGGSRKALELLENAGVPQRAIGRLYSQLRVGAINVAAQSGQVATGGGS